ncbi:MAG: hypothetical protein ACOCRK_04825, partial [bacterium]
MDKSGKSIIATLGIFLLIIMIVSFMSFTSFSTIKDNLVTADEDTSNQSSITEQQFSQPLPGKSGKVDYELYDGYGRE